MEVCNGRIGVGSEAPKFKTAGFDALKGRFETYSLEDYIGSYILLFFYPGDFTFVCPTELVALAVLKDQFESIGVKVFVISTDSKFSHKNWNELELSEALGNNYPYPMLSDTLGAIGSPYGIFDEENGVDLRGVVFIDKDGIIQLVYINAPPLGRNPKEILRLATAFKEHDTNGGVLPACWMPGEDTIAPTIDNSGKMWANYKGMLENEKKRV
ncbi:MAG: peroxiredoxin [Synergistaceae bacterium]|jgi:peroxiredoxin (alkyl hydroperoxide reductase subunit C)|nr:peroxiredoxin [Synergistaceae bacterium]